MRKTTIWMTAASLGLALATTAHAEPRERGFEAQSNAIQGRFLAGGGLFGRVIDDMPGHKISGEVVHAGRGCPGDYYPDVEGKVALVERGGCMFTAKAARAEQAGAIAVIVYNNASTGENVVAMAAPAGFNDTLAIPSALIGRSPGLALRQGKKPVMIQVKDKTRNHLETREN